MKDPLLEEFKVWLTDNGYSLIDSQLNTKQDAMFDAYKAGKISESSLRINLLDKVGG